MKDLYTENHKTLMKEIEEETQINGKISHTRGLRELILLKCPYSPKPSIDSVQSYQNSNDIFHRNRKNNPKICMEPQKTLNSQSNLVKEEQSLETSHSLISNYSWPLNNMGLNCKGPLTWIFDINCSCTTLSVVG